MSNAQQRAAVKSTAVRIANAERARLQTVAHFLRNPGQSAKVMAQKLGICGHTVANHLNASGYRFCRPCQRWLLRENFAGGACRECADFGKRPAEPPPGPPRVAIPHNLLDQIRTTDGRAMIQARTLETALQATYR